jgi:hypothetical protein
MKCPGCRKEIAIEAVEHSCGWRVSSEVATSSEVVAPPASREQVESHLARMREVVGSVPAPRPVVRGKAKVAMLTDVGHGEACCCEGCWVGRMKKVFPNATVQMPEAARPGTVGTDQHLESGFAEISSAPPLDDVPPEGMTRAEMLMKKFPLP